MHIGILTFHLAHNYGAVLQCYALQEVLRGMGHDVWVINYQQPFMSEWFRPKRQFGVRSFLKALKKGSLAEYMGKSMHPYKVAHQFEAFRKKYLRLTEKCYGVDDIPPMDLYLVGSDQPWNPNLTGGTDMVYYGQFPRPSTSQLATYAMSGSIEAISKVGWENVKQYTMSFDALSFREANLAKSISELTDRPCETVLDPTLLADASLWKPMINKRWSKHNYVLLYHVGGPKHVIEAITEKAKTIAKSEKLEFIDASHYQYSPSDFVSIIRHARYVITASFHAMVFSIIFHLPFVVVKTGQASDARFTNLLDSLGITGDVLRAPEDIRIPARIDDIAISKKLEKEKQVSINFLHKISS